MELHLRSNHLTPSVRSKQPASTAPHLADRTPPAGNDAMNTDTAKPIKSASYCLKYNSILHETRSTSHDNTHQFHLDGRWYASSWSSEDAAATVKNYNTSPAETEDDDEGDDDDDTDDQVKGSGGSGTQCETKKPLCAKSWGDSGPDYNRCLKYEGCDQANADPGQSRRIAPALRTA
jgi:hypothetical protein